MKKMIALIAALALTAMPLAAPAEESAAPMGSQVQFALADVQIAVNDTVLDFSGLELDIIQTMHADGASTVNVQGFVGERMAVGFEALTEGSRFTAAVRGLDGVYLDPVLTLDAAEALRPYAEAVKPYIDMFTDGSGSGIASGLLEDIQAKAMNALGVLMSYLARVQPESAVIEGYAFCDGAVADLNAQYYTVDSATLQALLTDLGAVFGASVPEDACSGVALGLGVAYSQDGRMLYALTVQKDEKVFETDVEIISAANGQTYYAAADVDDEVIAEVLFTYAQDGDSLECRYSLSTAETAEEVTFSGTVEGKSVTGVFACTALHGDETLAATGSLYASVVSPVENDAARDDLSAAEAVDVTTLGLSGALETAQSWLQGALGEGLELLKTVPGVAVLTESLSLTDAE